MLAIFFRENACLFQREPRYEHQTHPCLGPPFPLQNPFSAPGTEGTAGPALPSGKAREAGLRRGTSRARVPARPAGAPAGGRRQRPCPSARKPSPATRQAPGAPAGDTAITKPGGATAALTCPEVASCPRRRRRQAGAGFASGCSPCRGARARRRQRRRAHAPP